MDNMENYQNIMLVLWYLVELGHETSQIKNKIHIYNQLYKTTYFVGLPKAISSSFQEK